MMKLVQKILLTLVVTSINFASVASTETPVNVEHQLKHNFTLKQKQQDQFKNMVTDLVANGFGKMNIEKVKSYYNQDPELRFADADGPFHKGWKEYKVWLGKIFGGFVDKQKFLTRDVHSSRLSDDIVLTTLIIDNKTKLTNGELIDSAMRLSFIWMQTEGSWKIIHEHFSLWHGELAGPMGYPDNGKQIIELD
ncbi:YybH family protein [Shewanella sp. 1180_01]|uniref:YybH family protein n=1 Tax=Shewanella sp. 1180_01 TaxID=2604451 RepID=UPI004064564A